MMNLMKMKWNSKSGRDIVNLWLVNSSAIALQMYCGDALGTAPSKTPVPPEITRSELLTQSQIPERREFPLDESVSPCEDFHKYTCGKVESTFQLPDDRSAWTFSFTDSNERILEAKKKYFKLIEAGAKPRTERAQQFKNLYLACMAPKVRAKEERELVATEKAAILSLKDLSALQDFAQARIGSPDSTFIGFYNLPNLDDPTKNDMMLYADVMSLPEKTYYENPEALKDLRELAEKLFTDIKLSHPAKRAQQIVDFEKAFAESFPLPAELRQRENSKMYTGREDWIQKHPALKLDRFLKEIDTKVAFRNVTPESFQFLNQALASRPLEELQNVLLFQSLRDMMDQAYPEYFKKIFEFRRKHLGGPKVRPPLDERCTKMVMGNFGMELDNELLDVLFPDFPQDKVVSLAERVRTSIVEGLQGNKWLSKDAKAEAIRKVEKATLRLVKPLKDADWNFLPIQSYNPKQPIKNLMLIRKARIARELKELVEPRNRDQWYMGPLTVNAYYNPPDNQFVLPQGILQFPFYEAKMSDVEALGAMGAVIGHELGHGIDDQGSKYDAEGKLREWMTMKDLGEFQARGQKFVEQFNKAGHNGVLTLGENIGDHVGLMFAFNAAFKDRKAAKAEDIKKFYLGYGRVWCSVQRPEYQQVMLKTNPHALGWARINEQLKHQPEFQKAFSCKKGDKMFLPSEEQIRVW